MHERKSDDLIYQVELTRTSGLHVNMSTAEQRDSMSLLFLSTGRLSAVKVIYY